MSEFTHEDGLEVRRKLRAREGLTYREVVQLVGELVSVYSFFVRTVRQGPDLRTALINVVDIAEAVTSDIRDLFGLQRTEPVPTDDGSSGPPPGTLLN